MSRIDLYPLLLGLSWKDTLPDPLALALNSFYTLIFGFAALWGLGITRMLGRTKVSRNWWFIATGAVLLFLGNLWGTILNFLNYTSPLSTFTFLAFGAILFLIGIFMEYSQWRARSLEGYRDLEELFNTMIRLRHPDMSLDSQEGLKKYLKRNALGFPLAVVLSMVEEWAT